MAWRTRSSICGFWSALESANDYKLLDNIVPQLSPYKFLYFDEQLHILCQFKNRVDRFSFLQAMKLSVPINILRYDPGGGCESTVFLWQIPEERGLAEVMNMIMKVVERLQPRLPEYHSRRMRREFIQRYSTPYESILKAKYSNVCFALPYPKVKGDVSNPNKRFECVRKDSICKNGIFLFFFFQSLYPLNFSSNLQNRTHCFRIKWIDTKEIKELKQDYLSDNNNLMSQCCEIDIQIH
jgi:hypothetical protein